MPHNIQPSTGIFGLLLSVALMLSSFVVPEATQVHRPWEFPIWVMQSFQILAWTCVAGTFVITVLNYLGIKLFKKKEK